MMTDDDIKEVCSICWGELTQDELLYCRTVGGDLVCGSCQAELNEDDVENTGHEY